MITKRNSIFMRGLAPGLPPGATVSLLLRKPGLHSSRAGAHLRAHGLRGLDVLDTRLLHVDVDEHVDARLCGVDEPVLEAAVGGEEADGHLDEASLHVRHADVGELHRDPVLRRLPHVGADGVDKLAHLGPGGTCRHLELHDHVRGARPIQVDDGELTREEVADDVLLALPGDEACGQEADVRHGEVLSPSPAEARVADEDAVADVVGPD
mmetsp:Transcript_28815/g.84463  ORF Transcript_28815/g.84463 Transcript_28815/m.84463 type:complete len:210 (+) Transcript_28815:22-651(+)